MPHYADGSEAHVGDLVQTVAEDQKQKVIGILAQITLGSEYCNGNVIPCTVKFGEYAWVPAGQVHPWSVNIKDLQRLITNPVPVEKADVATS